MPSNVKLTAFLALILALSLNVALVAATKKRVAIIGGGPTGMIIGSKIIKSETLSANYELVGIIEARPHDKSMTRTNQVKIYSPIMSYLTRSAPEEEKKFLFDYRSEVGSVIDELIQVVSSSEPLELGKISKNNYVEYAPLFSDDDLLKKAHACNHEGTWEISVGNLQKLVHPIVKDKMVYNALGKWKVELPSEGSGKVKITFTEGITDDKGSTISSLPVWDHLDYVIVATGYSRNKDKKDVAEEFFKFPAHQPDSRCSVYGTILGLNKDKESSDRGKCFYAADTVIAPIKDSPMDVLSDTTMKDHVLLTVQTYGREKDAYAIVSCADLQCPAKNLGFLLEGESKSKAGLFKIYSLMKEKKSSLPEFTESDFDGLGAPGFWLLQTTRRQGDVVHKEFGQTMVLLEGDAAHAPNFLTGMGLQTNIVQMASLEIFLRDMHNLEPTRPVRPDPSWRRSVKTKRHSNVKRASDNIASKGRNLCN